jgi:type IV pilus assembly protein PilA
VPVLLGARERAVNRAAQSDLKNSLVAAKAVYTDELDYSSITPSDMQAAEPSLTFVAGGTQSSSTNSYAISFQVYNYGEIDAARRSETGICYFVRTIDEQGPSVLDVPGTYYGRGTGFCSGGAVAALATTPTNFVGW